MPNMVLLNLILGRQIKEFMAKNRTNASKLVTLKPFGNLPISILFLAICPLKFLNCYNDPHLVNFTLNSRIEFRIFALGFVLDLESIGRKWGFHLHMRRTWAFHDKFNGN